jgi:hypothetical protein
MYHAGWGRFLQPDPLGTITDNLQPGTNGTGNRANLYAYVGNDPLNAIDPLGLWTLQLGITLSGSFGPLSGSFSFGLVADLNGNIGGYSSLAGSGGAGSFVKFGGTGVISSADTIYDLASNNASGLNLAGAPKNLSQVSNITFGTGLGGSLDLSVGNANNGSQYGSWGLTLGAVAGAGASTGYQYTYINPLYQATQRPK